MQVCLKGTMQIIDMKMMPVAVVFLCVLANHLG